MSIQSIKREKKLGIVIHNKASFFWNGLTQNAYFLHQCCEAMGYSCQFLCGEANPDPFEHKGMSVKQITTDSAVFNPMEYHTIITVTTKVSDEVYAFLKVNKVGVVALVCGNNYMQDQEEFVKGIKDVTTFLGKSRNIDEQWLIPSYHHFIDYMELIRKKPAFLVPHLWSPEIIMTNAPLKINQPEAAMFYSLANRKSKKINLIIMEPNLNLYKSSWLPIMAAEKLHIEHPDLIDGVYIFNFPGHNHAGGMIEILTVAPKIQKFGRLTQVQIMNLFNNQSEHMPIIVSHQVLNSLNYLYYEMLYYGYPLIHNSPDLDGCGYKYAENNISECVKQILFAVKHHDKQLETYKDKAKEYLKRVDPLNPDVQKTFDQMITSSIVNCIKDDKKILNVSKAFVINLDRRSDRYELFKKNHPLMHLCVSRISATDGKKIQLTPDIVHLFHRNQFKWMKGVMGCALSHFNLWKQLAESSDSEYLIFEDDVKCATDFLEKFGDIMQHIPKDADLLYLGGVLPYNLDAYKTCVEPVNKYIGKIKENPHCGTNNSFFHFCTYSYVLTNKGAKKLISLLNKIGITHAIDMMLGKFVNVMTIYSSLPLITESTQFDDKEYINSDMIDISKTNKFDSDICNQSDCFTEEEINHVSVSSITHEQNISHDKS